jgi:hypothetical protein
MCCTVTSFSFILAFAADALKNPPYVVYCPKNEEVPEKSPPSGLTFGGFAKSEEESLPSLPKFPKLVDPKELPGVIPKRDVVPPKILALGG